MPPLFSCWSIAASRSSIWRCSCESRMFVSSMRRRASSSGKIAAFATCAARARAIAASAVRKESVFETLRFMAPHPNPSPSQAEGVRIKLLAGVQDVVAPILRPRRLVVAGVLRTLLAEAYGLDLVIARAEQRHHPLHG